MTAQELFAGAAWFLLYAITVFATVRSLPRVSPAALAVGAAVLYAAAAFPFFFFLPVQGNFWRAWTGYSFLAICYLMVFGAAYKSVSLQLMLDLLRAPGRRLPAQEVSSRYIEQQSFAARMEVMLAQGLATESQGGFSLTAKGGRIARAARAMQTLFGIETSG